MVGDKADQFDVDEALFTDSPENLFKRLGCEPFKNPEEFGDRPELLWLFMGFKYGFLEKFRHVHKLKCIRNILREKMFRTMFAKTKRAGLFEHFVTYAKNIVSYTEFERMLETSLVVRNGEFEVSEEIEEEVDVPKPPFDMECVVCGHVVKVLCVCTTPSP